MSVQGLHKTLKWEDFKGTPPANAKHDASTYSGISYNTSFSWQNGKNGYYKITSVTTTVVFDPNQSWVKPASKDPKLLKHEQGHYDIAAIATRDLFNQLNGLEENTPNLSNIERKQKLDTKVEKIYQDTFTKMKQIQANYDLETHHSQVESRQRSWNVKIKSVISNSNLGLKDL